MRTVAVSHFWRIARRASSPDVRAASQGHGRFDDPHSVVGAVYGARELRTCLYDALEPWAQAPGAASILEDGLRPSAGGEERDAAADRALARASRARSVPKSIYERDAVIVVGSDDIELLDLESASVRDRLASNPEVAAKMQSCGIAKLDRDALLSAAANPTLTQAVAGAAMRGLPGGRRPGGLCAPSRRSADIFVVFNGGAHEPKLRVILREPLTPQHRLLRDVARELGLQP